jgi:hypothetical protein
MRILPYICCIPGCHGFSHGNSIQYVMDLVVVSLVNLQDVMDSDRILYVLYAMDSVLVLLQNVLDSVRIINLQDVMNSVMVLKYTECHL